jgi:hypothetical protein
VKTGRPNPQEWKYLAESSKEGCGSKRAVFPISEFALRSYENHAEPRFRIADPGAEIRSRSADALDSVIY